MLLFVACSSDNFTPAATSAPQTATSEPSPTAAAQALAEGRNFGYVKAVDPRSHTLVFDLAEFLTGEEADKAAAEAGVIEEGEHADNDYFIRNENTRLRTVPYSTSAKVQVVDWSNCCELVAMELGRFEGLFRPSGHDEQYHGPDSQYWLTVRGGAVAEFQEQYLP